MTTPQQTARYQTNIGSSEPQQARGVAAENFFLVSATELERGDDFDRTLVAHIEAVVASKHYAISSNEVDEIAQRLRSMADRVVGEASEIARRRLLQRATLLSHLPPMVETADEIGKSPSGMRQADIELGKSIEESAKDEVGRGDCGIKRISQKVMQVVARKPLGPNDVKGMEKNWCS